MAALARMLALVGLVWASAGACNKPRPNACPGQNLSMCVAGDQCSFDEKRGCNVCVCKPLDDELSGPDPDDRSRPPE